MEIELSEDLQHYKESLVLGLTAKQFLFSALALGVGTGIVLLNSISIHNLLSLFFIYSVFALPTWFSVIHADCKRRQPQPGQTYAVPPDEISPPHTAPYRIVLSREAVFPIHAPE